jgi:hypothetical protein
MAVATVAIVRVVRRVLNQCAYTDMVMVGLACPSNLATSSESTPGENQGRGTGVAERVQRHRTQLGWQQGRASVLWVIVLRCFGVPASVGNTKLSCWVS